jgi:mono/diheme cytochrome c family protein
LPENWESLLTPLHLATQANLLQTVKLLFQIGANPTQLDAHGRTPYFLATTKEMRILYRKMRGILGETCWSWQRAGVPEAITSETVNQQKQKEKAKKKKAQQRKKEAKQKQLQVQQDALIAQQLHEKLLVEQQEVRRQAAGQCVQCHKALYGQEYFSVMDVKCCSTVCVAAWRRHLQAEAALARFKTPSTK